MELKALGQKLETMHSRGMPSIKFLKEEMKLHRANSKDGYPRDVTKTLSKMWDKKINVLIQT